MPSSSAGPGLVGDDRHVVARVAQAQRQRPCRPTRPAGARRDTPRCQHELHDTILPSTPLELLAVACPGVALDDTRLRAAAAQAARRNAGSSARRSMVAASASASASGRSRPSWPSRTISVSGARGSSRSGSPLAMYSKIFKRRPVEAETELAQPRRIVRRHADVGGRHDLGHRLVGHGAQSSCPRKPSAGPGVGSADEQEVEVLATGQPPRRPLERRGHRARAGSCR